MQYLHGSIRNYPWGSRTMLSRLRGESAPTERPEAELWFGAHPGAPSTIQDCSLTDIIAADPQTALGSRVCESLGEELPFLMKLLAAGAPLSLQAHPSAEQAVDGFERENQQGIALNAGDRNYKDPSHKPEVIVALTEFTALAGFRPIEQTRELFAALDCPDLDRYSAMLADDPAEEEANLRVLFTTWITIPAAKRVQLVSAVVDAAQTQLGRGDWISDALAAVVDLNDRYPGDIGVLGALLLNFLRLQPGEAVHLKAGQLHAYLHGLGVEVMANSDNVLRGGLTAKYVDIPELVRVLDFNSLADPVFVAEDDGAYPVPVEEFSLARHCFDDAGDRVDFDHDGPAIALCTGGTVQVGDMTLTPGTAVWIPASDPAATFSGAGATLFIARA